MKGKLLSCVLLSVTPWTSLPGSSVHGIFQARVLEWVVVSFSNRLLSGGTLGITDKMEARPQLPLLVLQTRTQDEGIRCNDSDLVFPLLG